MESLYLKLPTTLASRFSPTNLFRGDNELKFWLDCCWHPPNFSWSPLTLILSGSAGLGTTEALKRWAILCPFDTFFTLFVSCFVALLVGFIPLFIAFVAEALLFSFSIVDVRYWFLLDLYFLSLWDLFRLSSQGLRHRIRLHKFIDTFEIFILFKRIKISKVSKEIANAIWEVPRLRLQFLSISPRS